MGTMYGQMDIFSLTLPGFRVDRPVRLIELFAGIGSQAMALRDLGAGFEHHRVVELDRFALASYNAIHGTGFRPTDITQLSGADLGIADTDKYCYIMTYSFPCQDLSVAGRQKGMAEGSGTRSGLLWEVGRLLDEAEDLPQVLLMENVPQVHSRNNMPDFRKWVGFLEGKGYSNYWQDLNARDYGVAQNRDRCFMVSILGEYSYKFPQPVPLGKTMGDYLEDEVDEKYYINTEKAQKLIRQLIDSGTMDKAADFEMDGNFNQRGRVHGWDSICRTVMGGGSHCGNEPKVCVDLSINRPNKKTVANCIAAKDRGIGNRAGAGNGVAETRIRQLGNVMPTQRRGNPNQGRVYDASGLSPGICDAGGGGCRQPMVVAMRGRNPDSPSDRRAGIRTEQRLEPNSQGICNTLTSVQKDNMVLEKSIIQRPRGFNKGGEHEICPPLTSHSFQENNFLKGKYRIRKLTPLECWRLMGFSDGDFHKAEKVNSNSQLYKQAGNSIVKNVLMAVFGQMLPGKEGKEND